MQTEHEALLSLHDKRITVQNLRILGVVDISPMHVRVRKLQFETSLVEPDDEPIDIPTILDIGDDDAYKVAGHL